MIIFWFCTTSHIVLDGKLYFLDPEDQTWELKGSFEHILNGKEEEVEYELLNNQPTLHILRVSF